MFLSYKNILKLSVYTQSGQLLGKICNFEVDSDSQAIIRYFVKSSTLIQQVLGGEVWDKNKLLIIERGQVISIDNQKMIVKDELVLAREKSLRLSRQKILAPVVE